jgi:hypothetical protein
MVPAELAKRVPLFTTFLHGFVVRHIVAHTGPTQIYALA